MSNSSYSKLNYGYRPAKSIERKIIIEILKEIYGVRDAKKCAYIGMGSIFFSDFKLVHKELGIQRMINIEERIADKQRFEFNKPFSCIELKWGTTTDILPTLSWKGKKIIWTDYDGTLQRYMFEDIDIIFSNIESGSFYLMTCNHSLQKFFDSVVDCSKTPPTVSAIPNISNFKEEFHEYHPYTLSKEQLFRKNTPKLILDMVNARINHNLLQRNAATKEPDQLVYNQLLGITYQDSAPMFTTGGIILKKKHLFRLKRLSNYNFPYIRTDGTGILNIGSPILTNQEIDLLNSYLPNNKERFLQSGKTGFIPSEIRERYYETYRHYPSFVEIRES